MLYPDGMPRKATANPLGEFIRNRREIARLSLRQYANLAHISNPYLSQIERGLYEPSASVLKGNRNRAWISRPKGSTRRQAGLSLRAATSMRSRPQSVPIPA